MVVKLEGIINESKVIFENVGGDNWKAVIPPTLNGIYIVELVATDDAGNQGFATKYILTIDLDALCVHLKPLPYHAQLISSEYYSEIIVSEFHSDIAITNIYSEIFLSDFCAEINKKQECEGKHYDNCFR